VRWPLAAPLVALVLFTLAFRWTEWDLEVARRFFDAERQVWPWFGSSVCTWFYRKGAYPAFGLGLASAAWLGWSLVHRRRWQAMQASVFLLAVFVIGPGLIVNLALKTVWGRPRPHQVEEFGGKYHFVPVGTPGSMRGHNSSFPSGHASVAFYLMTPAFLVGRRRPWLARGLLAAGLIYGGGMGAVRVIQGGHFASDVVWSAAIVYFTAALLAPLILRGASDLSRGPAAGNYC
jgi:membrane-associated PAP2 superfamily phosphatase